MLDTHYRPHPGLILTGWALFAVVLQGLQARTLVFVSLPVVIVAFVTARGRFLNLLRRSRFLILALLLIYGFVTPGERLPFLPEWLPLRREGCLQAIRHILGLADLLASLAVLLEFMPLPRLISGLYSVSLPLRVIGVARERAALRLLLVLDGLQRRPKLGWRAWLTPEPASETGCVRIERDAWRAADYCLLALASVAAAVVVSA